MPNLCQRCRTPGEHHDDADAVLCASCYRLFLHDASLTCEERDRELSGEAANMVSDVYATSRGIQSVSLRCGCTAYPYAKQFDDCGRHREESRT